jgi:hypothetical protein
MIADRNSSNRLQMYQLKELYDEYEKYCFLQQIEVVESSPNVIKHIKEDITNSGLPLSSYLKQAGLENQIFTITKGIHNHKIYAYNLPAFITNKHYFNNIEIKKDVLVYAEDLARSFNLKYDNLIIAQDRQLYEKTYPEQLKNSKPEILNDKLNNKNTPILIPNKNGDTVASLNEKGMFSKEASDVIREVGNIIRERAESVSEIPVEHVIGMMNAARAITDNPEENKLVYESILKKASKSEDLDDYINQ